MRVAVDIGGTFTDVVVFDDKRGALSLAKTLSTPAELARGVLEGLIKAAFFGMVFATVCTYRGFNTTGGAKGVGEATNRGVVLSMVMIIVIDYFITNLIRLFYLTTGMR